MRFASVNAVQRAPGLGVAASWCEALLQHPQRPSQLIRVSESAHSSLHSALPPPALTGLGSTRSARSACTAPLQPAPSSEVRRSTVGSQLTPAQASLPALPLPRAPAAAAACSAAAPRPSISINCPCPPARCRRRQPGAMSSYKGGGGISTARRVLRVSRTGRESFDGTLSLQPPLSPRSTQGTAGRSSAGISRGPTADLEAPLLEQRSTEAAVAAELAAAARAAESDAREAAAARAAANGEEAVAAEEGAAGEPRSGRPSLTGPGYTKHRDSRQLWRSARNNLGEGGASIASAAARVQHCGACSPACAGSIA